MTEPLSTAARQSGNNEALTRADEAMRLASEALRVGTQARHHIERHEDRCEERWKSAYATMQRIETAVVGLYSRWWLIILAVVAGLLSFSAALFSRYVLP